MGNSRPDAQSYHGSRNNSQDSAASSVTDAEALPVLYNELEKAAVILARQLSDKPNK